MQQTVRPSHAFFKLVHDFVIEDSQTEKESEIKKEYWAKMKTELELAGYEQNMIGRIIKNSIEEEEYNQRFKDLGIPREEYVWHSGYFYRWCKAEGISHVFQKSPQRDSSIYTQEKEKIITLLEKTKLLCDELLKKIKTPTLMLEFSDEKYNDFYSQWGIILGIDEDAIDEKQKIPSNTVHVLLQCLAIESSLHFGAETFLRSRVKMMEETGKFLTPKQATKFQRGEIGEQSAILDPKSRDIAIFCRYYGQQCSNCNSYCMKEFLDGMKTKIRCVKCGKVEDPATVAKCRFCQNPLYKEDLLHIVKTGRCENCNEENHLPQELIKYATS